MYQPKSVTNWCNQWWVLGVSIGFLLVHLFPFLYFKQWPVLGFDTGFYRRYLIEPFTSLPHAAVPGLDHTVILPRVFLDLIRLTGLPIDVVLYGGYVLASALLFGGIFQKITPHACIGANFVMLGSNERQTTTYC